MAKKPAYEELEKRLKELEKETSERKQTEEALRESEERYRSLVESTEDSIYLVDRNCRYLLMNKMQLSRFGLAKDEGIGKAYGDFHSKEETKEFATKVKGVFRTGKSLSYEYGSQRGGGYFIRTLSPVRKQDGTTTSVTVVSKDISDYKRTEEALRTSQQYARNIIESSLDMIITVDTDRYIVEFNKAAEETLGYRRGEVIGRLADMLYADPEEGIAVHRKTLKRGQCVQEVLKNRKDSGTFPSLLSASLLRDAHGEVKGVMGVYRNITERKQAEEEKKEL